MSRFAESGEILKFFINPLALNAVFSVFCLLRRIMDGFVCQQSKRLAEL